LTPTEAKDFLGNYAFLAFPSVREWLEKTENPDATFGIWAKVLAPLDRSECERVIDTWIDGSVASPQAYQRDLFATHLRACAMHARGVAMRSDALRSQSEDLAKGQAVKPWSLATDDLYNERWLPLKEQVELGHLSKDEAFGQWRGILKEAFSK
jgi:hypothetical protein